MNRTLSPPTAPIHPGTVLRTGAVIPLVAVFLVILIAMAAFSVDVAYMQLVNTQLRIATDSAAKAGVSALMQGGGSSGAIKAAIDMATKNKVAGRPLSLTAADIEIGQSHLQSDGSWKFVPGAQPYQAMRVNSSLREGSANGPVRLFFAPALGNGPFTTRADAVASAYVCEICLVLDRSHSMCFDNAGINLQYPPPINTDWVTGYKTPPTAGSRWRALEQAIKSFCSVLQSTPSPPRVAVVTWATEIGKNTTEYQLTKQTSPAVTVDLPLSTDLNKVYNVVSARTKNVMLGGTNMASGIDQGIAVLTGPTVKPYAKRIMVLMTDGEWIEGRNPVLAAQEALAQNITIHCVCFLKQADQTTAQEIANLTGGKFYFASNQADLIEAFQDLAFRLPVVLTK